tara:strand:- start:635 stop:967 length:333 start_codon:yes stop_codon:yes gene_type:complete
MALIKIDTSSTTQADLIVDITVPVTITASAQDSVTVETNESGSSTIEIEWQTNWFDAAETVQLTHLMLNDAIVAGYGDPYAIPVLSEICKAGGYLEPNECKPFISYTYTA